MYVNLLTMNNLFAGNTSLCQAPSKPVAHKLANHFDPSTVGSTTSDSTPKTTTTDNTATGAQTEPASTSAQGFGHNFRKIVMTKMTEEAKNSAKLKKQNSPFIAAVQPDSAQPRSPQVLITALLSEGIITKINKSPAIKPKTQPALLTTAPKVHKSAETAMPTATKLDQLVSAKSQAGNKKPQLAAEQSQISPKGASPNSSDDLVLTGTSNTATKNGNQVLVKTAVTTKAIPKQQSGEEPKLDALAGNNKTAVVSEKTGMTDNSTVHNDPKTSTVGGKESMPQAFPNSSKMTTADGKSPIPDRGAVSPGQKTTVPNDSLPGLQVKSSDKEQKASVVPEKSAPTAEKPADNEVSRGQQGKAFTEFSGVNGKKQADNLSGELFGQKLNLTHGQVPTGQTKNYNSSDSSSGSKSDFEQILSHNNTQIPILERFPETPVQAAVKTAGNTPSGDAFASISEQILGSVHSSLRQGDHQITIRLNPPELGSVFIRFREQQDQITGLLEVSKIQTRYEIEQALPQIIRTLQNSGIQVKRLEVVLTDQPGQQAYKDQSLQDGSFQQHSFTQGDSSHNKSANQWLANPHSQDIPELQNVFITDSSINMLV